jgi:uncharacterized membrane protein YgdD (TMEM256/DUF423 family)
VVTNERLLGAIGGILAFASVAAGAFGAHALRARLSPELLATFETAARYQMYHALAIVLAALAYGRWAGHHALWAGWAFVIGSAVFSGSLYLLTLTGTRWWGAITPIGGVTLLVGWVLFVWGMLAGHR